MATKEVAIKIKIDGQEVTLNNKQVETFKKNIVNLRSELDKLGDRTEENAEIFDKLTGDLRQLEQVFGEVKDEATQAGDAVEEGGEKSEKAGEKTQSYAAQIRKLRTELAGLGERTSENAARYDELTSQIVDLSEKQEDLQFGTKKLDDSLSALPGPIGKAAQGFKFFDDGLKNAKSAMTNLTRTFPILKNAIAATGLGALVVLFGLLVAAVMKAFQSFKPLQDAVGKLGIVFDLLMKLVDPLIELIGKGLTIALEGLAKALAFVTGNMDEYNKAVADKKATEDLEKNVKRQEELLDANGYKYDEFTKRKIQANIDYNKKKLELDADETRSEAEKQALLKQYRDKADYEINQADVDRQKKADDNRKKEADATKAAADKAADLERDFQNRLSGLRDENTLLAIQDEQERGRKQLEIQKDNQIKEINQLKISEKKKQQLIDETNKNYALKLKEFNDNIKKEQEQADKDLVKQTRDIKISMIENEKQRLLAEAKARMDDAIEAIDKTKATEEAKEQAKKQIREKYELDKKNAEKAGEEKNKENIYRQIEFERESRSLGLQNRLKEIDLSVQSEVEKIEARRKVFTEQAELDRIAEIDNLKKLLDSKQITQSEYDTREKQINEATRLANLENTIASENEIRQTKFNIRQKALDDLISLAGQESDIGKALFIAKQILAARELVLEATRTIAFSKQALIRSKVAVAEGTAQTSKVGFPQNIPLLIAYAAQAAAIISAVISATKAANESKNEGQTSTSSSNLGKNYSTGGMIGGRRHAQGGTLIEAEAGEAVMTRGAVTLFQPVLSAMNQLGGGTAFNRNALMTSYDAPVVDQPAKSQEPVIMKTYVVSSELTTDVERQARLKDLSTL